MTTGAGVAVAGLRDPQLHIDGTALTIPRVLYPRPTLQQTLSQVMSGCYKMDAAFLGYFLPNVSDVYDFELHYDLASGLETEISFIERLRTAGVSHTLAYWKKIPYRYTGISGQAYFYLPRPDAYNHAGNSGDSYKAEISVNGTPIAAADTLYPGAVTSGTSVNAGQVKISTVSVAHPDSGRTVILFKFGTVPGAGALIKVDFHPLFNVLVDDVETSPFVSDRPFTEDKSVRLLEC